MSRALVPRPPQQVLTEGFKLQLTRADIATLGGLNWLNDEVRAVTCILLFYVPYIVISNIITIITVMMLSLFSVMFTLKL